MTRFTVTAPEPVEQIVHVSVEDSGKGVVVLFNGIPVVRFDPSEKQFMLLPVEEKIPGVGMTLYSGRYFIKQTGKSYRD